MTPPARILAATDLSAPARHAIERAARLASLDGSELHVCHAIELDALDSLRELLGEDLAATRSALEADARERLSQLLTGVAAQGSVTASPRVVSGTALRVVAGQADTLDVDLVVLGARGASFLRHATLGSTAMRLLRKSTWRPVLVVRQAPRQDYRSVLVAVDFSPASRLAIQMARRWAPGARLVLLHVFELPFEGMLSVAGVDEQAIKRYIHAGVDGRRRLVHELARGVDLAAGDYSVRVLHGDPSQQIVAMEQEYDADLIVMGKHGTHLVEEMLLGSVTKHVLAEAQGDVLVVADARPAERLSP